MMFPVLSLLVILRAELLKLQDSSAGRPTASVSRIPDLPEVVTLP
jgi:hypothetical protein